MKDQILVDTLNRWVQNEYDAYWAALPLGRVRKINRSWRLVPVGKIWAIQHLNSSGGASDNVSSTWAVLCCG